MRLGRTIRRAALILVAVIAAGAAVLYLLVSRVPGGYGPVHLGADEKDKAMGQFRRRIMDFNNDGQRNEAFTWSLTEEEINRYLEAADEIAVEQGAKPGAVPQALHKAGLSDLSVSLRDGALRLMARSTKYQKIISVRVSHRFDEAGKLYVGVEGLRVGLLPVPASFLREKVEAIRSALARSVRGGKGKSSGPTGLSAQDADEVARHILAALDGQPINTEVTWRISARKRVRIERIEIADGKLTLHVVPVPPREDK